MNKLLVILILLLPSLAVAQPALRPESDGGGNTRLSPVQDSWRGGLEIPSGTTAQRTASPSKEVLYTNTDDAELQFWNGSAWVSLATTTTLTSGSNNELLTDDGAGGVVSESGLTFDGTDFAVNTNDLFVKGSTGNVGINDTTPDSKLDIESATASDVGLIVQSTDDNTTNPALTVQGSGGGEVFSVEANGNVSATINSVSSQEILRITNNGSTSNTFAVLGIGRPGSYDDNFVIYLNSPVGVPALRIGASSEAVFGGDASVAQNKSFRSEVSPQGSFNPYDGSGHAVLQGKFGLEIQTQGIDRLSFVEDTQDELVVNDPGNDYDFRVETVNEANAFVIDGGNETASFNVPVSTPNDAVTLGAGATSIAVTSNVMRITGDAGGNTIATFTGASDGTRLTLIFVDALVTITDDNTHGPDSVDMPAAFTSADDKTLELVRDGTSWYGVSISTN